MSGARREPGSWAIHDGGRFGQYGPSGPSICAENEEAGTCQPLFQLVGRADAETCKANTTLAAAAPDLLAALTDLRAYLLHTVDEEYGLSGQSEEDEAEIERASGWTYHDVMDRVSVVLARAHGEVTP